MTSIQSQLEALDPCSLAAEYEASQRLISALRGVAEALTVAHSGISTQAGLKIIGELNFQLGDMIAELAHWTAKLAVARGAKS